MADRYLIVVAPYYKEVSDLLIAGTTAALKEAGAEVDIVEVPGALEIPAAIAVAAEEAPRYYQGYVALGCVIRGETTHYDYVCTESAHGLQQLALGSGLAIGNAILTVENREQAIVRADPAQKNKGADAASAALSLHRLRQDFRKLGTGA